MASMAMLHHAAGRRVRLNSNVSHRGAILVRAYRMHEAKRISNTLEAAAPQKTGVLPETQRLRRMYIQCPTPNEGNSMPSEAKVKGPASYFPSIEKTYGKPISHWMEVVRAVGDLKHMEIVGILKTEHRLGHGHANAIVAHYLANK
jgi:hypothetical protein